MVRPHDELKETVAEPRVFICAGELANPSAGRAEGSVPFAPIDQRVGMCNIAACCMEVRPEPIEIAENAFIARLGTGARPHPR